MFCTCQDHFEGKLSMSFVSTCLTTWRASHILCRKLACLCVCMRRCVQPKVIRSRDPQNPRISRRRPTLSQSVLTRFFQKNEVQYHIVVFYWHSNLVSSSGHQMGVSCPLVYAQFFLLMHFPFKYSQARSDLWDRCETTTQSIQALRCYRSLSDADRALLVCSPA